MENVSGIGVIGGANGEKTCRVEGGVVEILVRRQSALTAGLKFLVSGEINKCAQLW